MDTPAPAPAAPTKKAFYKKPLGCLLSLAVGGLLLLVLTAAFALWFAGSNKALDIASGVFGKKSGGELTFAENDNNLFAGRVHLKGIEIKNPSRFLDKQCLKINEIHAEVKPRTALGDRIEIPVVTLDLGTLSVVGAEKWREDNNLLDFKNAFVPAGTSPETKPADQPAPAEGPKKHFRIGKLTLRVDKIRIVSHATTPGQTPKIITETSLGLNREFVDVTDENILTTVVAPLKGDVLNLLLKSGKIGVDVLKAEGVSIVGDALKSGTGAASDAISGASGAVSGAASGVISGASDALGGLLGGKKKKEEPKP